MMNSFKDKNGKRFVACAINDNKPKVFALDELGVTLYVLSAVLLYGCGSKEGEIFRNPSSSETGNDFQNTITETDD